MDDAICWQLDLGRRCLDALLFWRDQLSLVKRKAPSPAAVAATGCGGCRRVEEEEEETRGKGRAQRDTVITHPGKETPLPPIRWLPPASVAATGCGDSRR